MSWSDSFEVYAFKFDPSTESWTRKNEIAFLRIDIGKNGVDMIKEIEEFVKKVKESSEFSSGEIIIDTNC